MFNFLTSTGKSSMKEYSRYDRQMILKEIGREGQKKLGNSCVAIIGLGALGSVSANLLARAGVGKLFLIDRDFLELNNLQRQMLYDEKDVRDHLPKAVAAENHLRGINSEIQIHGIVSDINANNIHAMLQGVDLILDGSDNFETRFLINDFSLQNQIPWIYGGAIRTEGMSYVILPGERPCLRCMFGEAPKHSHMQTCSQVGVLSTVSHLIASFQATEAIKILAGQRERVDPKMWKVDIWNKTFKSISVEHLMNFSCSGCSMDTYPYLEYHQGTQTLSLCGRNAVQIYKSNEDFIDFKALAERINDKAKVSFNDYILNIDSAPYEITVFRNGRAIIKGTEDQGQAKSLYSQFVGC